MHRVEIRLYRNELPDTMAQMRIWLDEHRFEPSFFSYNGYERAVLLRIAFNEAGAATAFAERFGGRMAAAA
jgi:hypothetical protein